MNLLPLWLAILWLAAAYLFVLGAVVLAGPALARRFLSAFAQGTRANLTEAGLRALAGVAFVGAALHTRHAPAATLIGLFLILTALLMALLPGAHRRFAPKATAIVFRAFPLFGVSAILMATVLVWFTV